MNAAGANRDLATLELVLKNVKNINQTNSKGVSALAMAVSNNSPEAVQLLLDKGADSKVVDKNGDNLIAYLFQAYSPQRAEEFEAKLKVLTA